MDKVNIDGNEGPKLIKIFTCEGCKYLIKAPFASYTSISTKPYKCFHDNIIIDQTWKNPNFGYNYICGDIGYDKITPSFCPLLLPKLRKEKLIKLEDY